MLSALDFLHSNSFGKVAMYHRDLSAKNTFMVGSIEDPYIKIGDFGLSQVGAHCSNMVGTPWFKAPEMDNKLIHAYCRTQFGHKHEDKCDVYSFGMIVYSMAVGMRYNDCGA